MTFRFGSLTLDSESRALVRDGRPVAISPKAFKLLQVLIEARPRAIPKAELHQRLWPDTVVSAVNLPTLIAEIRQAIGDGARAPEFIRTVYGYGYAFCGAAVSSRRDGSPATISDQIFRLLWGHREVALAEGENILGRGTDSLVGGHGARCEQEMYYRDYFEQLAARYPNFRYLVTLSQGGKQWQGLRGHVEDHARSIIESLSPQKRQDVHAYICGLNQMIKANRAMLMELGLPKKSILYERYD